MKILVILLSGTAVLLLSCAPSSEWARRTDWKERGIESLPDSAAYPDAGAVILLDEGRMEIVGGGELGFSQFEQHRVVKILNRRGHRFAYVVIPYASGSEVSDIQARTVTANGAITILDPKNVFDVSLYPNFVFFSDQRARIFTLPAVEDGSVIEYKYGLTIRGRTFWHSWYFQSEAPTLLSRFTLIKPSEWDVNARVYGITIEPAIARTPQGFKSTHTWEARNVEALRTEFAMPSRQEIAARLALAPAGFTTWDDVSKWYHELAASRMKAGAGLRALAATLAEGAASDAEKLQRIYEWVRDGIRYVAVEIGIGGFQPHPADEILVNKYGDCKDMTTILCALGKEAGLDVRPVLVSTWQNGKPDTSLPSPLQFNHAIAFCPTVGDSGIWMDATHKGCPFGQLPWYNQGLTVLVVGEKGEGQLQSTPREPAKNNREAIEWNAVLDSSGAAAVQGTTQLWGAEAAELRDALAHASPDERRLWLETWLAKRCAGVRLDSLTLSGLNPVRDPLRIGYVFRSGMFAWRKGSSMTLRPGRMAGTPLSDYFRAVTRLYPIRFGHGMTSEFHLHSTLPEGLSGEAELRSDSLVSPFGRSHWSWRAEPGTMVIHTSLEVEGGDISAAVYPKLQEFLDGVQRGDMREVVLTRK